MKTKTIFVQGMSCSHCENSIEKSLADNNIKAKANAKKGTVKVDEDAELALIRKIIEELGFNVK